MSSQDRFVTLDGMRGLAALVVAGAHISELLRIGVPPHAHLAVDFFFVLSGFVIAHAYGARLGTSMSPVDFIRVRVIRLHPLILLGSAISLATLVSRSIPGGAPGLAALAWTTAAGIVLLPVAQGPWAAAFPLNGPAWSLFAEYAVNIFFALIAASLTRGRLRMLLLVGIAMLLLLSFSRAGLESYWRADTVWLSALRVVYPFFAGVLINRLYCGARVRVPAISPVVSMTLLLAILLAPTTRFDTLFQFVMIVGVFPLLVLASARDRVTPAQARWMLIGGQLSYPIYMLHFPLAVLLVPIAAQFLPPAAALAAIIVCAIAASHLALRHYDEPVRAWLTARVKARRKPALAA